MARLRCLTVSFFMFCTLASFGDRAIAQTASPAAAPQSAAAKCSEPETKAPLQIVALQNGNGPHIGIAIGKNGEALGLGDAVAVVLDASTPLDASCYVLFLDGHPIDDLALSYYDSNLSALVYPLERTPKNAAQWVAILGSPTKLSKPVTVALGVRTPSGAPAAPSVTGPGGQRPVFMFLIAPPLRFMLAAAAVIAMIVLVWGQARRTTVLKDNLIPQIDPKRQPYSLGRWQMAVWFSLIFASYVFLYILVGDVNTLPAQALILMGISSATALAAIEVDVVKDSPDDAVNQALRLLGINSHADIVRINAEINNRQNQLGSASQPVSAATQMLLASEILDRQLKLRTYEEQIAPYVSEGWLKDISTDINGPALHRIQVVCWTLLLGVIFLIGVWTTLAMPTFSETLLALMGISGASYVGFKYPEKQQ